MKTNEALLALAAFEYADPGWKEAAHSYWLTPAKWPIDARGQVFIARAVHEVGKACFPNTWTGREPVERFLPFLDDPLLLLGISPLAECAIHVLNRWVEDRVPDEDGPLLSRREAILAVSLFEEHYGDARREGEARLREVIRILTVALADGALSSSTRAIAGGTFSPLSSDAWNADGIGWRFQYCVIGPDDPMAGWFGTPEQIESQLLNRAGFAGGSNS